MTTTLKAKFDGKVLIPVGPVELPIGPELEVTIMPPPLRPDGKTALQRLADALINARRRLRRRATFRHSMIITSTGRPNARHDLCGHGLLRGAADPADQHHLCARAWNAATTDYLLVTEYVIVEAVNSLSSVGFRDRAQKIVHSVMTEDQFIFMEASRLWLNARMALHRDRPDKDWSLTDCISFEVMRAERITRALSFDHHFVQAGFDALLRRDPV